jgi:hypothetical protein
MIGRVGIYVNMISIYHWIKVLERGAKSHSIGVLNRKKVDLIVCHLARHFPGWKTAGARDASGCSSKFPRFQGIGDISA